MTEQERKDRAEARKQARAAAKTQARIDAERNQKPVKRLEITVEWRRSRTWGHNPHATASVYYQDGTYERREGFTCSGCGYDKESTVVADIFNQYLRYTLWAMPEEKLTTGEPYGVYARGDYRGFSGGIGMSCYPKIAEFIGGKLENVASGKTFDAYTFTAKE